MIKQFADIVYAHIDNVFYVRPLLDKIAKIVHEDDDTSSNHEGASDRRAKLQIIATDTWDISDSLSKYRSIARLLEVDI